MQDEKNNPLINEDRAKKLLEKWGVLVDLYSPEALEKYQTRLATAILVESQETWINLK